MNEAQANLLKHGIVVLPEFLEHDVYEQVLTALVVERPALPVSIYCNGRGGSSETAFAIVDLIRQHGNVTGMLVGDASSSHVPIFAACQHRYVSPHGSIGLHMVAFNIDRSVDATYARLMAIDNDRTDRMTAALLAQISGKPALDWLRVIRAAGHAGCTVVWSHTLIRLGMAQPLSALRSVTNS